MIGVAPTARSGVDLQKLRPPGAGRDRRSDTVLFHWRAKLCEAGVACIGMASRSSVLPLRLAAEGDVIVEVNDVEPGLHVLAFLRKFADVLCEILKRFHVPARA